MRGDNHVLAVTTTTDEITGAVKPLFAFPIQICQAVDNREVKFDIAGPSGAPRKQVYTDSATGELIEDADCQRGIRVGDEFKPIAQEAIEQIEKATKIDTMVAEGTIDIADIPWQRTTGTYFIQSPVKGGSPKSYRLLYEALLADERAIVSKRTARSRQKLCVIYASKDMGCLMMTELRFAAQLKSPDEQILAPQAAQVDAKQIAMAQKVLSTLGDGADALANETDEVIALKQGLMEKALEGRTLTVPTPIAETEASDDLSALLEASLEAATA